MDSRITARQQLAHRRGGICAITVCVLGMGMPEGIPVITLALLCMLAMLPLGPGAWRESLGCEPRLRYMTAAAVGGIGMYFVVRASHWAIGALPGVLTLILVGPFLEELLMRGVLWTALRRLLPAWPAIITSAGVFTAHHGPDRMTHLPGIFVGGIILGWLRHRSGSLAPAVLGHSAYNTMVVLS